MKDNKIIYGVRAIIEYIKAGKHVSKIFINKHAYNKTSELFKEVITLIKQESIPISKVPLNKLDKLIGFNSTKNHQGIVAYTSPVVFANLDNLIQSIFEKGKIPLILILDEITDVRNLGAIIRTACCMKVDGILIPSNVSASISSDTMKTSCGGLAYVPICREKKIFEAIKYLKNSGLNIASLSEKAQELIYDFDFTLPTALVLGSEKDGIKKEILEISNSILKIPISGPLSSLNVSNAAAIACYEGYKQRLKEGRQLNLPFTEKQ